MENDPARLPLLAAHTNELMSGLNYEEVRLFNMALRHYAHYAGRVAHS